MHFQTIFNENIVQWITYSHSQLSRLLVHKQFENSRRNWKGYFTAFNLFVYISEMKSKQWSIFDVNHGKSLFYRRITNQSGFQKLNFSSFIVLKFKSNFWKCSVQMWHIFILLNKYSISILWKYVKLYRSKYTRNCRGKKTPVKSPSDTQHQW